MRRSSTGGSSAPVRVLRLFANIAGGVALFSPLCALAQEEQTVVCFVAPSEERSQLFKEAKARIGGELRASGFDVVGGAMGSGSDGEIQRWECPVGAATITLEVEGSTLTIWSQVSGAHQPLSQTLDLANPATTAEVIAIRAVDGLRAAVLEAIVANQNAVSRPLAEFASGKREGAKERASEPKQEPQKKDPSPAVAAEPSRSDAPAHRSPKPSRSAPLMGIVTFGPELVFGTGKPGLSFNASIDLWWKSLGLGLVADATLLAPSWETQGSRIALREYALGARAQFSPCSRPWVCQLGAGLSVRTLGFDAVQSLYGSEILERGAHTSAATDLGIALGHWFSPAVGVVASGWGHVYWNAPRLVIGDEETVWGRPSYGVTIGPFFRL